MKKVSLFVVESYNDDDTTHRILRQAVTQWEEVTDEDFELLQRHKHVLQRDIEKSYGYNFQLVIVVQDTHSAFERITTIKAFLEQEKARIEREKAEREQKAALRKAKREKTAQGEVDRLKAELALAELKLQQNAAQANTK